RRQHVAGVPRLRGVQSSAGRRGESRDGEEVGGADRRRPEAKVSGFHEGGTADGHGIRRHAAVAGGDQRERRVPGAAEWALVFGRWSFVLGLRSLVVRWLRTTDDQRLLFFQELHPYTALDTADHATDGSAVGRELACEVPCLRVGELPVDSTVFHRE